MRNSLLETLAFTRPLGTFFWPSPLMPYWDGQMLKGTDVTWTQLVAARTLWDSQALIASCPENKALRRLSFPTFLPSAVGDLKEIHGDSSCFFCNDTPLFSGQAIVLAWYEAMNEY